MPGGPGVRWDGGVEAGDEVTLFYDSLLGKLIVWAPNRAEAIARMARALDELVDRGVATNQGFHRRLMADAAFRDGRHRHPVPGAPHRSAGDTVADEDRPPTLAIAAALAEDEARERRAAPVAVARDRVPRAARRSSARPGATWTALR